MPLLVMHLGNVHWLRVEAGSLDERGARMLDRLSRGVDVLRADW